jgi:hypothetical protein
MGDNFVDFGSANRVQVFDRKHVLFPLLDALHGAPIAVGQLGGLTHYLTSSAKINRLARSTHCCPPGARAPLVNTLEPKRKLL